MIQTTRRGFMGLSAAAMGAVLAGCAGGAGDAENTEPVEAVINEEPCEVRVGSLKGPTSIGIATFMEVAKAGETQNSYTFTVAASADEIVPAFVKGELDVVLIPANAASVVYSKTEGAVSVIDINTMGVLSVVSADASITDIADLAGKTVVMTGKGTTPEYVMTYLLEKAGIADQVTLDFKSEATEVVSALAADVAAVAVLPQPYVTAAMMKNPDLKICVDLNDAWTRYADEGSQMVTGVTVVRNDFLTQSPAAVREFIEQQQLSVDKANDDPAYAAARVVEYGIIDNAAVVEGAIPHCHLVCTTGAQMKDALSGYLEVLFSMDPSSVGGGLPADDFYYLG